MVKSHTKYSMRKERIERFFFSCPFVLFLVAELVIPIAAILLASIFALVVILPISLICGWF